MSVKPIPFKAEMIRAALEGRKTQHRVPLKPQPTNIRQSPFVPSGLEDTHGWEVKPKYFPGDLLWVRETWAKTHVFQAMQEWFVYCTEDNRTDYGGPWKPSIFMPREASRLTLEVTGVRVQRVQEISEADAKAEGVAFDADGWIDYLMPATQCCRNARDSFRTLWDSINEKRGFGWAADPWIVAITFNVHQINVDALLARREGASAA